MQIDRPIIKFMYSIIVICEGYYSFVATKVDVFSCFIIFFIYFFRFVFLFFGKGSSLVKLASMPFCGGNVCNYIHRFFVVTVFIFVIFYMVTPQLCCLIEDHHDDTAELCEVLQPVYTCMYYIQYICISV